MLLEREADLQRFAELIDDVPRTGGRVVLVRGEAGIGKSALIAELCRRRDDVDVLLGGCDDLLTPQTLGPIWDLAPKSPALADALGRADVRAVQTALFELLCRSLRPTILVLEDSQWADEATLDVIRHIGRRITRTNGLLVLTYRDNELDLEHPLRQVLGDLPPVSVVRMSIQRLTAEAIARLIGGDQRAADEALRQTDGNPLYLREVLLAEPGTIPASVHDMVLARVARVDGPARQLLDLVAVVPGGAEEALIRAIAPDALAGLGSAIAAGLLRATPDRIEFLHELQRRAVEDALPLHRRRELNRAVLTALEATADPGRLAHHAREAADVDALLCLAPAAARTAAAAGSHQVAVSHLTSIVPFLDRLEPGDAAGILMHLALQTHEVGGPDALTHAARAIAQLRGVAGRPGLVPALVQCAYLYKDHLDTESALAAAVEAVELAEAEGDEPMLARALQALGIVTWMYFEEPTRALPIVDRALLTAERCGDTKTAIAATATKGSILFSIVTADGIELVEAARSLAVAEGDRRHETSLLHAMAGMYADVRNLAPAADMARRAIETSVRHEIRVTEMHARALYAEILMWQGRWDEAIDAASLALDSHPHTAAIAWRVLGTIQARRGATGARAALARMWDVAGPAHALSVTDPAAAALAEHLWLSGGDDDELARELDDVLAFGTRVGNPWPSGGFAFWMWKLGRLDLPPAGSQDFYTWIMRGEVTLAVEFWRSRAIRYEQALALMHGTDAERLEALRLCDDLGAGALASRIRSELARRGVPVPRGRSRAARTHPAGLTARQAEVLDLLADGLTNAEIADRLFLSPRTAENHVAAILVKLDAATRDEAVRRAGALHLIQRSVLH